jgi:hypothetical protein
MDSEELLGRLRDYMPVELEFYHLKFMNRTKNLKDVDDLYEIIDLLHANYLVQKEVFTRLVRHLHSEGCSFPSLDELMDK